MKLLDKVSSELLFFCWKDLRRDSNLLLLNNTFVYEKSTYFIPLSWFFKVSKLIKLGYLDYSKYLCTPKLDSELFFNKKVFKKYIKGLIIQRAFLFVLKPYFLMYRGYYSFNLTHCLRVAIR